MTRRRAALKVLRAILVVGAASVACASPDRQLAEQIQAAAENGASGVVDLPQLTSFEWDRLFVFAPYTPSSTVEKELGFSWTGSGRIEAYDHFVLLVFVSAKRVVRFVEQPRRTDFAPCWRVGGYSRSEAVFRFTLDSTRARRCAAIL